MPMNLKRHQQIVRYSLIVVLCFCYSQYCSGENWGHWRGANGNSVSETATPPTEWGPNKNIKWKVAIPGSGSGSPVIWGDRVFVVSAVPTDGQTFQFVLYCFDRASGKQRWQQITTVGQPHEGTHSTNGFASASPCTDGKHVYAHFGSQGLF